MIKVLITGVAGLLGSRLADYLCDNNICEVVGIDDLSGGYFENVNPKVKFYKLELSSDSFLDNIFKKNKFDYVFHFAAYAAEGLSPFIRSFNYKNNLISTTKIINNCIKNDVNRLIFTSSMAVYGAAEPPFIESYKPNPIDPYGIAKYACEMDIQIAGEQHNLDWCIIRPHNVYGENQNIWDKYRNVLGIWMYKKINNLPFTIYGDGEQKRAFSYIDDCVEYIWKCATLKEASKQIINMGGLKEYKIKDAANILAEVVGGSEIIYLPARHEVKNAWVSHEKAKTILKFDDSKTSLKEGLTKMWEWAKKQPIRKQFLWEEYEIEKGIYDYWKVNKKNNSIINLTEFNI
jgi:UDP-glucose 4-epimerase